MLYSTYDEQGDVIGGKGYLYIGQISKPEQITNAIENFTATEADSFVKYNIENMDNIALTVGGMRLTIGDVTYNPITTPSGELSSIFYQFNKESIQASTGIAAFNMDLYSKYLLPFTESTKTDGYSCLTYGVKDTQGCKIFDLMFVQEDKKSNTKYVWLLFNCYAEPRAEFNTDAKTVMVMNHNFIVNKSSKHNTLRADKPIYILKIEGDNENGNT